MEVTSCIGIHFGKGGVGFEAEVSMLVALPAAEPFLSLLVTVLRVTASFAAVWGLVSSAVFSCPTSLLSLVPSAPLTAAGRDEPCVSFAGQWERPSLHEQTGCGGPSVQVLLAAAALSRAAPLWRQGCCFCLKCSFFCSISLNSVSELFTKSTYVLAKKPKLSFR